ncbi:hypothetical protein B0T20DRAFT_210721 [Sordaria brevicollis]|uniref:Ubiquitin carrier protein n=1 Tax=Sordaria brevicollis TaxID=83679 RepID=A0AAE0PEK8_SORBR|nr:hypothetical protein B0T20DRAFT_210721 [Sordaria brevicollis]
MSYHTAALGGSLVKRYMEDGLNLKVRSDSGPSGPSTGRLILDFLPIVVFIVTAVAFLLPAIGVFYTLHTVYPTLAMVEDPNPPPEYTPVPLDPQELQGSAATGDFQLLENNERPITSSIRRTHELLWRFGWRQYHRGIGCAFAAAWCTGALTVLIMVYTPLPHFVGSFIATLLLTQLHTAWVHVVMTPPSSRPWYYRTLPFRYVFRATALPLLVYWAASAVAIELPRLLALVLGLSDETPDRYTDPLKGTMLLAKGAPVVALAIFLYLFVVIPARVILVRVQASLLPPTEDAIVPFDRSFKGKLDPAVLGGGSETFLSMRDALQSFGREGWKRLVKMYVKIIAINVAFQILLFGTFWLEYIIAYLTVWRDAYTRGG